MSVSVNITRRERRRKLNSGAIVMLTRWVSAEILRSVLNNRLVA